MTKISNDFITEAKKIMEASRAKAALDPVGKEDADVNNDGKVDSTDKYLIKRRKVVTAAVKTEEVEPVDEGKTYRKNNKDDYENNSNYDKKNKYTDRAKARFNKNKKMEVDEEAEPIEEISKKTLGSYVKKASGDAVSTVMSGIANVQHADENRSKDPAYADALDKKGSQLFRKTNRRLAGIGKAADRLTKEEAEPIEEVSKALLGRYIKGAARSADSSRVFQGIKSTEADEYHMKAISKPKKRETFMKHKENAENTAQWAAKRANKRIRGISKATDKLTKEETEISEEGGQSAAERYDALHRASKDLLASIGKHLTEHKAKANAHQRTPSLRANGPHWGHVGEMKDIHTQLSNIHDQLAQRGEYSRVNEEAVLDEDFSGIEVEHDEYGYGVTLGINEDIAEVSFDHGVEFTEVNELYVTKAKRGRPSSKEEENPDAEADRHIISQLRKASYATVPHKVTFKDGGQHPVERHHAIRVLHKFSLLKKPDEKEAFQDKIAKSHDNFKSEV